MPLDVAHDPGPRKADFDATPRSASRAKWKDSQVLNNAPQHGMILQAPRQHRERTHEPSVAWFALHQCGSLADLCEERTVRHGRRSAGKLTDFCHPAMLQIGSGIQEPRVKSVLEKKEPLVC